MASEISEARIAEIRDRYRLAGILIPPDLEAGAISTADFMLSGLYRLHSGRPAADEPALIYTLTERAPE